MWLKNRTHARRTGAPTKPTPIQCACHRTQWTSRAMQCDLINTVVASRIQVPESPPPEARPLPLTCLRLQGVHDHGTSTFTGTSTSMGRRRPRGVCVHGRPRPWPRRTYIGADAGEIYETSWTKSTSMGFLTARAHRASTHTYHHESFGPAKKTYASARRRSSAPQIKAQNQSLALQRS